MNVLTYYQPEATLSAIGAKTVETRPMDTKHRGWTAIHAAKHTPDEWAAQRSVHPYTDVLARFVPGYLELGHKALPSGVIIGVYWLAAVTDAFRATEGWKVREQFALPGDQADYDDVPKYEIAFGDYTRGRKAWWTCMIFALDEPIPCRGMPGLWDTRLLHPEADRFQVDTTELRIRADILGLHGVDISKHAMDDAALWRLVNRRGALGMGPIAKGKR